MSIIAAILSFVSYRLSKREYNLQFKLYSDGLANFNFKIVDVCIKDNKEYNKIQYWFNLLITNLSDKQTSIVEYSLRLECLSNIVYKPEYVLSDNIKNSDIACLEMPQNMEAHSSLKGWCVFELPKNTFEELEIELCTITLKDIHEKKLPKHSFILRRNLSIMISKIRRKIISENRIVDVVNDALIYQRNLCDGKAIPHLILDTENFPEVAKSIELHQGVNEGGGITFIWGMSTDKRYILLSVDSISPVEISYVIKFDLYRQCSVIDRILSSHLMYIQAGKKGDRLLNTPNQPKLLLEVPNTGFEKDILGKRKRKDLKN